MKCEGGGGGGGWLMRDIAILISRNCDTCIECSHNSHVCRSRDDLRQTDRWIKTPSYRGPAAGYLQYKVDDTTEEVFRRDWMRYQSRLCEVTVWALTMLEYMYLFILDYCLDKYWRKKHVCILYNYNTTICSIHCGCVVFTWYWCFKLLTTSRLVPWSFVTGFILWY